MNREYNSRVSLKKLGAVA